MGRTREIFEGGPGEFSEEINGEISDKFEQQSQKNLFKKSWRNPQRTHREITEGIPMGILVEIQQKRAPGGTLISIDSQKAMQQYWITLTHLEISITRAPMKMFPSENLLLLGF